MPALKSRTLALAAHQARALHYTVILRRYTEDTVDLSAAVIATVDGIQVASLSVKPGLRPDQLAAMASSLLAVAGAAGREVGHSACDRLFIESRNGTLLIKPLGPEGDLVLCLAMSPGSVLAKALWSADEIGKALASS